MHATNGNEATEGLWGYREVAEYLKVSPKTVRKWASEKRLPVVKVGNRNRFRRSDIDRWLDERTEGGK